MSERLTPEEADLRQARTAAHECESIAGQLAEFAEGMSVVLTPAEIAELDTLIAREAAAQSRRNDAFGRLGLGVRSLGTDGSAG